MATNKMMRKEAGTIAYQLREIKDLGREANEENPSVAVSVVGGRTVTADELAKEIAASCTIKNASRVSTSSCMAPIMPSFVMKFFLSCLGAAYRSFRKPRTSSVYPIFS